MTRQSWQPNRIRRYVRTDFLVPAKMLSPKSVREKMLSRKTVRGKAVRDGPATLSFVFLPKRDLLKEGGKPPVEFVDFKFEETGLRLSPEATIEAILRAKNKGDAKRVVRTVEKGSAATRRVLREKVVVERSPPVAMELAALLQSADLSLGMLKGSGLSGLVLFGLSSIGYIAGSSVVGIGEGMRKGLTKVVETFWKEKIRKKKKKKKMKKKEAKKKKRMKLRR